MRRIAVLLLVSQFIIASPAFAAPAKSVEYVNKKYGITVPLNSTWKGYAVREIVTEIGTTILSFQVPGVGESRGTLLPVMFIHVYPAPKFKRKDIDQLQRYLGKNTKYFFSYSISDDPSRDIPEKIRFAVAKTPKVKIYTPVKAPKMRK